MNRNDSDNAGRERDQGMIGGTMERARSVGEQAWSAASTPVATAQDLARRAREQTSVATDTLYQQGQRAGEYLSRNVNQYPMTALLVAGAIGYGMAYLIHSSGAWQMQGWHRDGNWDGTERRRRESTRHQRD